MITLIIASVTALADLITKWLAWTYWPHLMVSNTGLAFSIPVPPIFAIIFTTAVLAVLFWYYWSQKNNLKTSEQFAFGFILGGALGNFLERIFSGQVSDFIHIAGGVFNLADIFIFLGLAILACAIFKKNH